MNLKNIIAVSGESSLFKLVSNKNNGLILADLESGKTKFFSVRSYQFTPLETVGIYTMTDTVDLRDIFEKMRSAGIEIPSPSNKTPGSELMKYFNQILPDYDRDRVHGGDVKKVIKWFNKSQEFGLLDLPEDEEE